MARLWSLQDALNGLLVASLTVGFFLIRFTGQGFVTMAGRNMVAKWWEYHRGKVFAIYGNRSKCLLFVSADRILRVDTSDRLAVGMENIGNLACGWGCVSGMALFFATIPKNAG